MPYRLQPDEPLASGFRRIAEEQLTIAINNLQQERIYEARKTLKKARAVLRILAPQLGAIYTEENRRLRDVARRFSVLRDTDVALELIVELAGHYKRKSTLNPQRTALSDRQTKLRQGVDFPAQFRAATDALAETRKRIEDWPLHELTADSLDNQLKKIHKQSHQRFKHAWQTRTAEDFHELRKSVKLELNQLRLLNAPEPQIHDLKQLSSLLGDHHNLAILTASLENTSVRFRLMTRKRQKAFESQILELSAMLYSNF